MIRQHSFSALQPGPHLVLLGAVHGNETSGTQGLNQLIDQFDQQILKLVKGQVSIIPICNPEAYARQQRFHERNLNRELYEKENPTAYEDFINPILCKLLKSADVLLDLHSYMSPGGPFVFLGTSSTAEIDYGRHLGIDQIVYGWTEAFGKTTQDPRKNMGTTEFARANGAIAATVETGQHDNVDGPTIAYRTAIAALSYFGMINSPALVPQQQSFVQMQLTFYKEKAGVLAKTWQHYDSVSKGQVLASYNDGSLLEAPEDGCIILPKSHAVIGDEWFFFGKMTHCPLAS